jgi:hypothetical protein
MPIEDSEKSSRYARIRTIVSNLDSHAQDASDIHQGYDLIAAIVNEGDKK